MTLKTFNNQSGASASFLGGNAACVGAIVLFACGFPAAGVLLETWGPVSLIAARTGLAVLLLLPLWLWFEGWRAVYQAPWLRGLWIGAIGFGIGTLILLVSQSMTNAVTAALVAAMMPVAAVALEVLFDGRRLTANFLAGVVLVLIGGFMATGANLMQGSFGLGAALGVVATFLFAWGSRKTVKSLPMMTSFGQTTLTLVGTMLFCQAALIVFFAMGWQGTQSAALDSTGWALLLIYAWGAMAASQAFWIVAVSKLGIGLASFHLNAAPFYVMLILLAMGGSWDWGQALGAGIVVIGVVLAQRNDRRNMVAAE